MKFKLLIIIVLIVMAFFFGDAVRIFYDSFLNQQNSSVLKLKKVIHDFDTVSYNSKSSVFFHYSNASENNLVINNIQTNCGCTVGDWNNTPIMKNQIDSLEVIFSAEDKGYFLREITIISNSKTSPDRVYIKGYVY